MVKINKGCIIKIRTEYVQANLLVQKVLGKRIYYSVVYSDYYHNYEDLKYEKMAYIDRDVVEKGESITVELNNLES
jgi:hypothetical protein